MAKKISASDIFAEEDIFLGIRQSAEKTILTFQEIDAEVKKMGANLKKELSSADFGNTKGINEFVSATQKANQAKEESIKIDKILSQATKDMAAADKALIDIEIKKQKLAQEQLRTNQQIAKSEEAKAKAASKAAQASKVQMDSYKGLAASTRDLKNQSKELGAQLLSLEKSGQKSTAAYAQLEQQFREVTAAAQAGDAELKSIDKTVGDNFRNVGNYEEATKGLKQQLREMTQALQNMETTDPRFRQMSIDAGNLKDQINDTNAVIKSTAGSAVENLGNGIAKAGKVGIDAFAGWTGAMGLFGIESESAMQAMLKLQQLAAVSEALQSLGALGDTMTEIKASFMAATAKLGLFTVAKEVDTVVTEGQTVATQGASVATKGLGKAMTALPIIAIVAGIAALVAAFVDWGSETSTLEMEQDALSSTMDSYNQAATDATKKTLEVGNAFKMAESGVMSKKEALKVYNDTLGDTFGKANDVNEAERLYREKTSAYIKATGLRAQADMLLNKAAEERVKAIETKIQAEKIIANLGKGGFDPFGNVIDAAALKAAKQSIIDSQKQAQVFEDMALKLQTESYELEKNTGLTMSNTTAVVANNTVKKQAIDLTSYYAKLTADVAHALSNLKDKHLELAEVEKLTMDPAKLEQALLVDEQRALIISDIALIEAEIALSKAKQIGDSKAIEEAEKAILKAKENQIKAQLKLDLATGDKTPAEREKLEKQAELDVLNLGNEKILEAEKSHQKSMQEVVKMASDYFIKNSERKVAQIDKEISAAEKQFETLKTLAENGNINAKESLAEQQRIINEANARKEKEMKRQQRIKLAESVYSTYTAKVAAGSEHPLMETIKDTMLLQQFIASLPTFFDGTEDTGKNGNGIDGKGGFHAVLHPNERVIPKSLNEQIGSLSNEALAKMANEYQNGKLMRSNSQMGSALETALLINELKDLKQTIQMKPETNIGIGEITQSVMEIVKSTKQGNTTTYNRYKVRR
jgi:hypothetical protein